MQALSTFLEEAFKELKQAALKATHPFHIVQIATIDGNQQTTIRSVVVRAFDPKHPLFAFTLILEAQNGKRCVTIIMYRFTGMIKH